MIKKFDRLGKESGRIRPGKELKYEIREVMDKIDLIIDVINKAEKSKETGETNAGSNKGKETGKPKGKP